MLNLFYTKNPLLLLNKDENMPYNWILDYFTHQRYSQFKYYYIKINMCKIIIQNTNFIINYHYLTKVIKIELPSTFSKNFCITKLVLKLHGVGYKIINYTIPKMLVLIMGYSHKLHIRLPQTIVYRVNKDKTSIELLSYNKILLTTIISKLKKLHKYDPYKGKGFTLLGNIFIPKFYKK